MRSYSTCLILEGREEVTIMASLLREERDLQYKPDNSESRESYNTGLSTEGGESVTYQASRYNKG